MFQVTPDQEINLVIGDMLSDGLLIVELPPPSVTTPMSQACMIMTPDLPGEGGDEASPETEMVGRFDVAATKRKSFGRNPSYGEGVIVGDVWLEGCGLSVLLMGQCGVGSGLELIDKQSN